MALTPGARIGSYEVGSPLGEGGMGVVFRAHDTKLQRDVALKLLPDHFANDPDRLSRFRREAQVLASLNHPNIAQIYGLEESDNTRCIVMEYVDGETLQERLKRGAMPVDEALSVARQIAEALEAAHERGIIHRDLKPANIKLTPLEKVKVLDFGLAKSLQDQQPASLSNSPTLMSAPVAGMVLGTASYMSPEQAKGKATDRTADVWAFGCVLYEMLTAHPVFEGETVGEIFGAVFRAEPEWNRLPPDTPEAIRRLLRRCLRKDYRHRLQSVGDARIELEDAQEEPRLESGGVAHTPRFRGRLAWISISILITAFAVVAVIKDFHSVPSPREVQVDINAPPTSSPTSFAMSPDGQNVVFSGTLNGRSMLWLRSLDSNSPRALAGTENATLPFWSPDNRS
ncbi:MAG: serine/threonine-protein kinase, partial [Verrucomicrobia bacterium]